MVPAGRTGWSRAGLPSLNNFSRLCGVVTVSVCLAPGPGVIRAGENGPEFMTPQAPEREVEDSRCQRIRNKENKKA